MCINDITKGDDENVSAAVRAAIERGYSLSFMESLTEARLKKEGEIDRICARHYNDFLSSVAEMLRMRGSASSLTTLVGQVHQDFRSGGEDLINLLSELEVLQSEGEQTEKVLECLLRCKDIASLMVQIRQQINLQDHYVAMCTIERLHAQQSALPPLPRPLTVCLDKWLPAIIEQLLRATTVESDDLLKSLRGKCLIIGQIVLHKQALISADQVDVVSSASFDDHNAESSVFRELSESSSFAVQILRRCMQPLRLKEWATRSDIELCSPAPSHHDFLEENSSLMDGLPGNLGQLHKALHVAGILNQLTSLHDHMRNERWAFLTETMDEAEKDMRHKLNDGSLYSMDSLSPLLSKIAGFFMLECLIRRCVERPEGIYSWSEITGLWDKACIHLDILLAKQSDTLRTPEQVLRIKDELAVLAEAAGNEAIGLRPIGIQETIRLLWRKFEELQVEAVQKSASDMLDNSTYEPITIRTESSLQSLIITYRLDALELDIPEQQSSAGGNGGADSSGGGSEILEAKMGLNSGAKGNTAGRDTAHLPQTFPFSNFVPHVQHSLYMTVTRIIAFTAKGSLTVNRCDAACTAILRVYEGVAAVMGKELSRDAGNTPLIKVCQISIDAAAVAAASDSVWQLLTASQRTLRWNQGRDGHFATCNASAKGVMMQISMTAQDVIVELLGLKVTELLGSIVFIDYLPEVLPRFLYFSSQ